MLKFSPCLSIVALVLLVLPSGNAHSQTPSYPADAPPVAEASQPRPYTLPIDTSEESAPVVEVNRGRTWPPAVSVPPLPQAAAIVPQIPGINQLEGSAEQVPADWFSVQPSGHLESVNVESAGEQAIDVEPVTVEPFGVEPDDVCHCNPSPRYCRDCPRCRDRWSLMPKEIFPGCIGGWLQQGFTSNFGSPHDRRNAPVLFNDRSNDYRLNQLYFYAERTVTPNDRDWDLGGRVDVLLGSDARFVTVPGLERHRDRTPKWNSETDDYGIAIPQAYVELAAPWMSGVSLKAGHFYSIAGYETVAAPENFFYSHAYTFLYGEPFTHTGALLTSQPNKRVKFQLGGTTGWDVFDSVSDEWGVLAGVTLTSADERTSLAATMHSGQDVTSARVGGVLLEEDRHFYSLVLQHQINKCWRYVFQHDFGYQEAGELVVNVAASRITGDTAKWYGINQYLIHDINDQLSSALRVEWFRDQDHSRLGIPVSFNPGGPTFKGGNYVAVTGGINWRPHRNITVRPELRWDYSDLKGNGNAPGGNPDFRAFDDNTSSSQGTAALDVIVHY